MAGSTWWPPGNAAFGPLPRRSTLPDAIRGKKTQVRDMHESPNKQAGRLQ